jgi:CheY-like chemotaxis protein
MLQNRTFTHEETRTLDVLWDIYYSMMTLHMIINRATDYNKLTVGYTLTPNSSPVNLCELLHIVVSSCGTLRVEGSAHPACSMRAAQGVVSLYVAADVAEEGQTDVSWLRDNLLCIVGNAVKYSMASVRIGVRSVVASGRRMIEFDAQDSGPDTLTTQQLKAMFDRPIQFARENVGGMGVGLYCLSERVAVLGGDCGARTRADRKSGTVVWFRVPFEPCVTGRKALKSELLAAKLVMSLKKIVTSPDKKGPNGSTGSRSDRDDEDLRGTPDGSLSPRGVGTEKVAENTPISDTVSVQTGPLIGLHILAVDDSAAILKMMVRMLSGAGAIVTSAKDGREAAQLAVLTAFGKN